MVLVGVLLLAANLRAGITAVGPVLGDIRGDLGLGSAAASFLISLPLIGFATISPLAPGLARRFGLDRALGGSLLLLAVAITARSVPVTGAIWAGTVVLGVAVAILNVLLPALVKREYPGRVGRLTGLYSAVQSAVAALTAGFAVPIANATPAGWRLSLGVWAALALIGFAAFLPLIRNRAGRTPAGPRQTPDRTPDRDIRLDTMTLELPGHAGAGRLWSSTLAWQVTMFLALQSTVYYVVITWWPSIEQDHGFSAGSAGWHQLVFQVFGIVGALVAAALIHRWRSQSLLTGCVAMLVPVGACGQLLAPGAAILWIALIGIAAGATITIALSLFGLRTRDHHQAAALSGMAQSVGYLVAACGPIVIGAIHAATGSWTVPLLIVVVAGLAEVTLGVLAGRDRHLAG